MDQALGPALGHGAEMCPGSWGDALLLEMGPSHDFPPSCRLCRVTQGGCWTPARWDAQPQARNRGAEPCQILPFLLCYRAVLAQLQERSCPHPGSWDLLCRGGLFPLTVSVRIKSQGCSLERSLLGCVSLYIACPWDGLAIAELFLSGDCILKAYWWCCHVPSPLVPLL